MQPYRRGDLDHSPMLVFYEITRACDLVCQHCRACAQPGADPNELTTEQSKRLIAQMVQFPRPPLLVFTGGDPIKRTDVFDLVAHANSVGLETAMTPSATPLVTREALHCLRDAGLRRLAVSLDAADARTHDGFRGVQGSFDRTLRIIAEAHDVGLPVQVNTTVTRHNVHQLDQIAQLLAGQRIVLWSVFFLIPVGRGQAEQRLSAEQCEEVFAKLWEHSRRQPYAIKTTEAPHYRRFLLQRQKNAPQKHPDAEKDEGTEQARPRSAMSQIGTNDGRGVMFVSHTGDIYPSGFMPICAGKFPLDSIIDVYQRSTLFRALRDADQFKGKCGQCEYRHICGGSRARSYALTGDPLAAEPDCVYEPVRAGPCADAATLECRRTDTASVASASPDQTSESRTSSAA